MSNPLERWKITSSDGLLTVTPEQEKLNAHIVSVCQELSRKILTEESRLLLAHLDDLSLEKLYLMVAKELKNRMG